MKLADWQDKKGFTDKNLGEQIGVTGEAVRLWRTGKRIPREPFLKVIAKLSRGAVTQWSNAKPRKPGPDAYEWPPKKTWNGKK